MYYYFLLLYIILVWQQPEADRLSEIGLPEALNDLERWCDFLGAGCGGRGFATGAASSSIFITTLLLGESVFFGKGGKLTGLWFTNGYWCGLTLSYGPV